MKNSSKHQSPRKARILGATILGALLAGAQAYASSSPFPQIPLGISNASSLAPNLIFLLDDSGSMQWDWIGSQGYWLQSAFNNYLLDYGFPLGNSNLFGASTYGDQIPSFSSQDILAAQFRSAAINPIYYNPATNYTPWACPAPYPNSPNTSPIPSVAGRACVWNGQLNLWLMPNADPTQTLLNPAIPSGAGYRDFTNWNNSGNAQSTASNNGFAGNNSNNSTSWYFVYNGSIQYYNGKYINNIYQIYNAYFNNQSIPNPQYGFWPAVYFNYFGNNSTSSQNSISNYQKVEICPSPAPTNPYGNAACITPPSLPANPLPNHTYYQNGNYIFITASGKQITRSYSAEIQNYANWYQYYRNHIFMARGAVSQAFMQLPDNYRVDFATINNITDGGQNNTGSPQYSTRQLFSLNYRNNFLTQLFDQQIPPQGTPSRLALSAVGNWLMQTPSQGKAPWGPSNEEAQNYGQKVFSCRQNYTVFVTDGGWNDDNGGSNGANSPISTANGQTVGNADDVTGPNMTGASGQTYQYTPNPPYQDTSSGNSTKWSNSLANIAFWYWENDLQPGMPGNVPTNPSDPAFWQHMVTFTVGMGVQGILPYPSALQQIEAGTLNWPNPFPSQGGNNPALIDDLWHAGINGHGNYYSATNPTSLADSLNAALQNIQTRTQSTSSVAVTGTQLAQNSIAYVPSYTSGVWTGDVQAYLYNPSTGTFATTAAWSAQKNISAQGSSRNIFTMGSSGAVAFQTGNLSAAQTTALTNPAYVSGATIAQVVANISGNTSQDGVLFRNRNGQVLGDIIDASPQYVGAPNLYYTFPGYGQFAAANASRIPVLYTPANDGMLHAIDACAASYPSGVTPPAGCTSGTAQQNAGKELWAYIPNAVLPYLDQRISLSNFSHQYLMDSTPTIGDFCTGGSGTGNSGTCTAWESLLVASEGRGVPGIYALNVTNPTPTASQLSPWEITPSTSGFSAMGYVISQPLLVKTQSMGWVVVFGSGYQSTPTSSGNGYLYFVNPNNGSLLTTLTLPNQVAGSQLSVAGIAAASFNSPGYAQALYVTDNEGDVWKVKLPTNASPPQGTQSPSSAPTLGYNGGPMFVATDGSGNRQPISTTPVVSQDTQGRIGVMFGTGQWLFSSDTTDNLTQSLYGVWDVNQTYPGTMTTPITRTSLVQQTLSTTTTSNTTGGTTYNTRTSTSNPVTYSSAPGGKMGWYIDLPITGERVIVNPLLVFGDVIFTSYVPGASSTDPCTSSNGTSWITAVNYLTGAVPSTNPFGFTGTAASVVSIQVAGQAPQPTVTSSPTGLKLLLPGAGGGTTPQSINFFPPFNGGAATRAWTQR
jgi:type IV pilus assembly protein PilY1